MKNLKRALSNGEIMWGVIILSSSPVNIGISGYLGYDFAFIDSEHAAASPYGMEMENLIGAADAADITPVVRVIENNLSQIRKPLDFSPTENQPVCRRPATGREVTVTPACRGGAGRLSAQRRFLHTLSLQVRGSPEWPRVP